MDLGIDADKLREALIYLIIVVASLALHEWGHAFVADRLGDPTPRSQGRVTLNPVAHIDWFGTLVIPFLCAIGFFGGFGMIGWAKPVWTNPSNFRRGHFDSALVTLAGPGVNFLLALLATLAAALAEHVMPSLTPLLAKVISVNVGLFMFNLLPIPPLDGSKFLIYWFGMKEEAYLSFARWGTLILVVVINLQAGQAILERLFKIAFLPFGLLFRALT